MKGNKEAGFLIRRKDLSAFAYSALSRPRNIAPGASNLRLSTACQCCHQPRTLLLGPIHTRPLSSVVLGIGVIKRQCLKLRF